MIFLKQKNLKTEGLAEQFGISSDSPGWGERCPEAEKREKKRRIPFQSPHRVSVPKF